MIAELRDLSPTRAAGILARATIAIESGGFNPASRPFLKDELHLREIILKQAREALGDSDGLSVIDSERLTDWLDLQMEELAVPYDEQGALDRLATEAALPSDMYDIKFGDDIYQPAGFNDRPYAALAIRSPDMIEEYGADISNDGVPLVSLFAKWFTAMRKGQRFLLIVCGSRRGTELLVSQIWRVADKKIGINSGAPLSQVFEEFAGEYGLKFRVQDGEEIVFLKSRSIPWHLGTHANLIGFPVTKTNFQMSSIMQQGDGFIHLAFVMIVNIDKYNRDMKRLGSEIMTERIAALPAILEPKSEL